MQPLELLSVDRAIEVALDLDAGEGGGRPSIPPGDSWLARELRDRILSLPSSDLPWGGYMAIDRACRRVVGTCGFRGAPSAEPEVEIAYHTFPGFEGRGYATRMALALVELAWTDPAILSVRAHTLPRPGASTRVLQKAGMRHAGEALDPAEGLVWRWELPRPRKDSSTP